MSLAPQDPVLEGLDPLPRRGLGLSILAALIGVILPEAGVASSAARAVAPDVRALPHVRVPETAASRSAVAGEAAVGSISLPAATSRSMKRGGGRGSQGPIILTYRTYERSNRILDARTISLHYVTGPRVSAGSRHLRATGRTMDSRSLRTGRSLPVAAVATVSSVEFTTCRGICSIGVPVPVT